MKPATTTLAERLVMSREKREMSQDRVAALAKMTQQSYSDLERGLSKRTTRVGSLAHVLGVDAYWLETGEGEPYGRPGVGEEPAAYDVITDQERQVIEALRSMDPVQRQGLMAFIAPRKK